MEDEPQESGVDASPSTQSRIAIATPALAARERAILMMLTGLDAGRVYDLDRDETILGRGKRAHVRLDDVDVSRQNTRIVRHGSGFAIEDLGSRNGTFRNGARLTSPARLAPGDRIQLGPAAALRFTLVDEAEEKLARQLFEASTRDPLTQCYNRRYFDQRLHAEIAFAHRHQTCVAIVLLDIDHFKRVNDTFGHAAGDEVLCAVAANIERAIRVEDTFARYGGEELAILVRGVSRAGVRAFAERVRAVIAAGVVHTDGRAIAVTASGGVASLSECASGSPDDLVLLADTRLYKAKAQGRNRICAD